MVNSVDGLYSVSDIYIHSVNPESLGVKEVCALSLVCTDYNQISKKPEIWEKLFKIEGIPFVESDGSSTRNFRKEFSILYPIMISSRIIAGIHGKVVGPLPLMRRDWFERLNQPDPFDPSKLYKDNYVIVVDPVSVERISRKFNAIQGRDEIHIEQTPLSLKNFLSLCENPLDIAKKVTVFDAKSYTAAFKNHPEVSAKVGLFIMRKSLVEETRGISFENMKAYVEQVDQGLTVSPLRQRALFDSITILKSGNCYDGKGDDQWSYALTSDTVTDCNQLCHVYIGGYSQREGVSVHYTLRPQKCMGAVPYASVAVEEIKELTSDFEKLSLEIK